MTIARYEIDGGAHYGLLEGEALRRISGSPFGSREPTGRMDDLKAVRLLAAQENKTGRGSTTEAGRDEFWRGMAHHRRGQRAWTRERLVDPSPALERVTERFQLTGNGMAR